MSKYNLEKKFTSLLLEQAHEKGGEIIGFKRRWDEFEAKVAYYKEKRSWTWNEKLKKELQ